ncbi:MAG: hypothetical protein V1725_03075 [archaeon]
MSLALAALITSIMEKRELASLDSSFIARLLDEHLTPQVQAVLDSDLTQKQVLRNAQVIALIKEVRSILHETYGMFVLEKTGQKEKLLDKYVRHELSLDALDAALLSLHRSSKERLPFYPRLYAELFAIIGMPNSVVDLAAGMNPCSYGFLGCSPHYIAVELSKTHCTFLNTYFARTKRNGEARAQDLTRGKERIVGDLCLLFKTVDTLESLERGSSIRVLQRIHAKHVVLSFPTRSLGGKRLAIREPWILKHIPYSVVGMVELPNERCYVLTR